MSLSLRGKHPRLQSWRVQRGTPLDGAHNRVAVTTTPAMGSHRNFCFDPRDDAVNDNRRSRIPAWSALNRVPTQVPTMTPRFDPWRKLYFRAGYDGPVTPDSGASFRKHL